MKKNIKLYEIILKEINNNSNITEVEIAKRYYYSERTIRRYIKDLKNEKIIKLIKNGKERYWKLL